MYKTYPEDFFLLSRQIRLRKLDEYLMQSSIVANPHKEPDAAKEFIEDLLEHRRFMRGEPEAPEELDVAAFAGFKDHIQKESRMVGAK